MTCLIYFLTFFQIAITSSRLSLVRKLLESGSFWSSTSCSFLNLIDHIYIWYFILSGARTVPQEFNGTSAQVGLVSSPLQLARTRLSLLQQTRLNLNKDAIKEMVQILRILQFYINSEVSTQWRDGSSSISDSQPANDLGRGIDSLCDRLETSLNFTSVPPPTTEQQQPGTSTSSQLILYSTNGLIMPHISETMDQISDLFDSLGIV